MMVYIVFNQVRGLVESVWSTPELASSAVHYHAADSRRSIFEYTIAVRELDTAKLKRE